jgi:hypothetical protein
VNVGVVLSGISDFLFTPTVVVVSSLLCLAMAIYCIAKGSYLLKLLCDDPTKREEMRRLLAKQTDALNCCSDEMRKTNQRVDELMDAIGVIVQEQSESLKLLSVVITTIKVSGIRNHAETDPIDQAVQMLQRRCAPEEISQKTGLDVPTVETLIKIHATR